MSKGTKVLYNSDFLYPSLCVGAFSLMMWLGTTLYAYMGGPLPVVGAKVIAGVSAALFVVLYLAAYSFSPKRWWLHRTIVKAVAETELLSARLQLEEILAGKASGSGELSNAEEK